MPVIRPFSAMRSTLEEVEKADKEENADIEVAVPVQELLNVRIMRRFSCMNFREERWQKLFTRDLMKECVPTYEKLFSWIAEQGKRIVGPVREVYFNDPREVPPEEILTEIYAPID